ncbi:MAG TPA: protein kinase, partial [Humisphaera sp.]|nr:protein kinase [Humisphaera sp.]
RLKLVHCDFKPHNVLRCKGDKVKVIDFGQTCKVGFGKNRVQGTPDFIAPEQVKCQAVDEKTDIYSFGASLYWALTGNRVPTYFTVDKKDHDVVKFQEFPSPMEVNKAIPADLSKLVMQCLMYSPDRRVADMITALNALSSSLTAAPRA